MTQGGKEKLAVGVVTALITGGLAVAVALLTKPPVTNISLPDGQSIDAAQVMSALAELESYREEDAKLASTNQKKIDTVTRESIEDDSPKELADIFLVDSVDYEKRDGLFTDSFGNHYTGVHVLKAGNFHNPYAVFNLNKSYSSFSAKLVASPDTGSDFVYIIQIFADDKLVFLKEDFDKRVGAVDLDLNVAHATTLTIKMNIANDHWDNGEDHNIYFVDATVS